MTYFGDRKNENAARSIDCATKLFELPVDECQSLPPPTGGMFEYVSGANYLGEITEWAGFALAGQSVQSLAFAVFTLVVLASRAVAHHK